MSDQGRNVDGLLVRDACRNLGIQKLHSSPYHPQGDGEAERCIQSFKQSMRYLLAEEGLDRRAWPQILQQVSFTHNAQSNASTGFSPNEIMFGSRLRTKIPSIETGGYTDMDTYHEKAARDNANLYQKVTANTEDAQRRMKRYYDQGTSVSKINPGDWVLVKDECRIDSLSPIFKGPWRVVERWDGNVRISDPCSAKTRVIHINLCKKSDPRTMGAKFYKYEVKVGGRGASVVSDPSGGMGGLPPEKKFIARYTDIDL